MTNLYAYSIKETADIGSIDTQLRLVVKGYCSIFRTRISITQ